MLSEAAKAAILAELPRLTLALKPAAARVLTWLTTEALRRGSTSIAASCRDVADGAGLNKSSSIRGTSELVTLQLIAKRQGTARRPAAYLLSFAETAKFSGRLKRPPPPTEWSGTERPEWSLKATTETENGAAFDASATDVLSIDVCNSTVDDSIDRSSDHLENEAHRTECRNLMTGYVRQKMRMHDAHPPDQTILSMMLRVAEWETLRRWLNSMLQFDSKEPPPNIGSPYAWMVAVAVQKIHGIAPEEQRATLKMLRGGKQLTSKWAEHKPQRDPAERLTAAEREELDKLIAEHAAREEGGKQ